MKVKDLIRNIFVANLDLDAEIGISIPNSFDMQPFEVCVRLGDDHRVCLVPIGLDDNVSWGTASQDFPMFTRDIYITKGDAYKYAVFGVDIAQEWAENFPSEILEFDNGVLFKGARFNRSAADMFDDSEWEPLYNILAGSEEAMALYEGWVPASEAECEPSSEYFIRESRKWVKLHESIEKMKEYLDREND